MTTLLVTGVCAGCGVPLPPNRGPGRRRKWCSDTCRKHTQYTGVCVDCGAATYRGDSATPPERCNTCAHRHRRVWTREAIVDAIREWARRYGSPPSATDWHSSHARKLGHPEKAARFDENTSCPTSTTVQDRFGSWNAAIVAAGFQPLAVGTYGRPGESLDLCREIADRYAHGESAPRLAREYGCTYTAIAYRIRKAGGRLRTRAEAQALRRTRGSR